MCSRRYGDCFTLQLPFFPPEVFFSHPDAIKEIFTGDPDQLLAGQANAPLLGPLVGAGSLLLLDGPRHLRERRLMLPPFHGERMQAYGETMRAIATASIDRWPLGRPISMHQQMVDITFDVILRTVLGFEEGENVARLRAALGRLIRLGQNPVWAWFQVNLSALTRRGRLTRLKALVDQLIFAEIAARRAAPSARSDVVSLLMEARYEDGSAMSDQDLRDEMITLLAAGHETTATALAWAIYHILRHPEVTERLCDELRSAAGGAPEPAKLEYLDATIKESLRLTPVIPAVGRVLATPMRIGGRDLPAGVEVVPCVYLTHRRPDVWSKPEQFRPERFLGARPHPYAFVPFGGGVRRCIGMSFALYEMKIVLSEVFSRVAMKLRPGYRARIRTRTITFTPSAGVPVIIESKRA